MTLIELVSEWMEGWTHAELIEWMSGIEFKSYLDDNGLTGIHLRTWEVNVAVDGAGLWRIPIEDDEEVEGPHRERWSTHVHGDLHVDLDMTYVGNATIKPVALVAWRVC